MKDKPTVECQVCGCGPWSLNEQGENIMEQHALLTGHENYVVSDGGWIHIPAPPFHVICSCGFETWDRPAWERHIRDAGYQHGFRRITPKGEKVVQP
ncbi:MAG: hypothetical protein JRN19_01685 [Nitrososphaerota archaeon]|nr:hypothetical protein [Nitrososphaerota archaeon]MDG7048652.1 hypothetical protein [Nitrososphaerota archaeon]MDG7051151.1 hypothetical protein [Nitrososphaerota archaeon]